jgi:magnesium and cobalt transporter
VNSDGRSLGILERIARMLLPEPDSREALHQILADAHARHVLDSATLGMIEGVLRISEQRARDVMVPRSQMVVVRRDDDLPAMLAVVAESEHSRYPVIGEHRDEVVGILLAKDLLAYVDPARERRFNVKDVLRPAVFVPESKRLDVLLREFRVGRNHMAIVADEYGGVAGLVTIEDVLEEIVGDIEDEYDIDEDEPFIQEAAEGAAQVHALTPIEEFNAHFGTTFSDTEFDTVGGLVLHLFGHVPAAGERVEHAGLAFAVLAADRRRVERLEVRRTSAPEAVDG